MLVLALQFSRDGPIAVKCAPSTRTDRRRLSTGCDRRRGMSSLTTEQERPATRAPVVPPNASSSSRLGKGGGVGGDPNRRITSDRRRSSRKCEHFEKCSLLRKEVIQ